MSERGSRTQVGSSGLPLPCDGWPGDGWNRFVGQVKRDAILVGFCVAILSAFRVVLLLSQGNAISAESRSVDLAVVLLNGLRFDGKVAAIVAMPAFLASLACLARDFVRRAERLRRGLGTVFLAVTIPLCAVDLFYFREYGAQFDHFVLGAVYDDLGAVLATVWKSYPVIPGFLAITLLGIASVALLRRALAASRPARLDRAAAKEPAGVPFRAVSISAAIALFVLVLRGSLTSRPVEERDAAVTRDPVLNELVLNPHLALAYALHDWRELESASGLHVHLPDGDVRAAAARVAGGGSALADLDQALLRRARGSTRPAPRHVFLVIMESYDAWTLDPRFESLHLADEMKALGREGSLLDRFVPASSGTMSTLAAIVTGLADAGVHTNYQPSARLPFPSSIAPIFRRLGYRTRLFYGGYLSWQRVGDFCREQGFEDIYGAAHMAQWARTNEWGVDDETLFDFVDRTVGDEAPSFDLVLTTSNHPPYDIDVWEMGWPVREIPADFAQGFAESGLSLREIGHHAYADMQMGRFVRKVADRLPSAVFAVTGDHYSRKFPGARPRLYERTAVPLLLYGRERLPLFASEGIGSHLDIAPTLIELAAPPGFEYHAVGRSLFDPDRARLAIGPVGRVIGPRWIADVDRDLAWEPLPGRLAPEAEPDLAAAKRARGDVLGLAWWRIMRGPSWPEASPGAR